MLKALHSMLSHVAHEVERFHNSKKRLALPLKLTQAGPVLHLSSTNCAQPNLGNGCELMGINRTSVNNDSH